MENSSDRVLSCGERAPAFVLASILASYPDDGFMNNVDVLFGDPLVGKTLVGLGGGGWESLRPQLLVLLSSLERLNDLRSEFIDIFDRGRQSNSLYETEYGRARSLVKGGELVDIAGFYQAFGFELGEEGPHRDMVDHVAIELEFYALLLMKQQALTEAGDKEGVEIVLDARRKFLKDHLGCFVGAIGERPGVSASSFYGAVFATLRDLVADECTVLGVAPQRVSWLDGEGDKGDLSCGGSQCLSGDPAARADLDAQREIFGQTPGV